MTNSEQPIVIRKNAARRLYNTQTSAPITLDDVAALVKGGHDLVVYEAKTGKDITRYILIQVIFEQEKKIGQNLMSIAFLRQLIGLYGNGMQMLVRQYLEVSMELLAREQESFRPLNGEGRKVATTGARG